MKNVIIIVFCTALLASCSSVRVATDYNPEAGFNQYRSFAFYKPGIDQADISDLDKKRILKAIELELVKKGFTKSADPDILVSIFTKTRENINIYQNNWGYGYGWGWSPYYWGAGYNTTSSTIEGTLYIDLIDQTSMELVWQGMGTGALANSNVNRKIERINEIVTKILERYPPEKKGK